LATLCNVGEDTSDITDIELIQHINVDCPRLTKLLSGLFSTNFCRMLLTEFNDLTQLQRTNQIHRVPDKKGPL